MGLIKEPVNVDFTVISKTWTAEERKEFSELIKNQKEMRNKKRSYFPENHHFSKQHRVFDVIY